MAWLVFRGNGIGGEEVWFEMGSEGGFFLFGYEGMNVF